MVQLLAEPGEQVERGLGDDGAWEEHRGVIPPDDVPTLKEMGAAAVFLPGTVIAESALDLLARLREQLHH